MESLCLDADGRKTIANEFAARTRGLSVTEELPDRLFKLLILKAEKPQKCRGKG